MMIQTVQGAIEKQNLGNVFMHEHVGCISNDLLQVFGKDWLDKETLADFAADVLKGLKETYGVGLFVDGTPIDLGRDISLLKSVSEKSGVHIVASSGLYHYPASWTSGRSDAEIASWFIKEFEAGIEKTDIKPGILKVASSRNSVAADNEKRLRAMAMVQKETNLPIYVHCEHTKDMAKSQLEILLSIIADPKKIIMGHAALCQDSGYPESILNQGCYICIDQCHCCGYSAEVTGKTVAELCRKGYAEQIFLSNDMCIYSDFGTKERDGFHLTVSEQIEQFGFIFKDIFASYIKCGGTEKDWNRMLQQNPIQVLDI